MTIFPMLAVAGNVIANGPFDYTGTTLSDVSFSGTGGAQQSAGTLKVCAGDNQSTVFPADSHDGTEQPTAVATFSVFDITQVEDASGNLINVDIPLGSADGARIVNAVTIDPNTWTFYADGTHCPSTSTVTVNNPNLPDYGQYQITVKAQAIGTGIGTGPGGTFKLTATPSSCLDTTAPNVTINTPLNGSAPLLGAIPVSITANDPDTPIGCGTGVVSITSTVSSAGGIINNQTVQLTTDVPKPAGVDAHGTGNFTPIDGAAGGLASGSPTPGLFNVNPIPSGIGRYTLKAFATDGAGNVGEADAGLTVNYNVVFSMATGNIVSGHPANSSAKFVFTANRAGSPSSDGAFMEDQSVTLVLQPCGGGDPINPVAQHVYGTGDVKDVVQFDPTTGAYQTHFVRSDIGASSSASYQAEVYFMDVDNVLIKEKTSSCVSF
jgi:hypothetical protein